MDSSPGHRLHRLGSDRVRRSAGRSRGSPQLKRFQFMNDHASVVRVERPAVGAGKRAGAGGGGEPPGGGGGGSGGERGGSSGPAGGGGGGACGGAGGGGARGAGPH